MTRSKNRSFYISSANTFNLISSNSIVTLSFSFIFSLFDVVALITGIAIGSGNEVEQRFSKLSESEEASESSLRLESSPTSSSFLLRSEIFSNLNSFGSSKGNNSFGWLLLLLLFIVLILFTAILIFGCLHFAIVTRKRIL